MKITLSKPTENDASEIAELRTTVAERLTRDFGPGPWSFGGSEKGVLYAMRNSILLATRASGKIIGVLQLGKKKPWAIDKTYFSPAKLPLYLTGMAVAPDRQRCGIGRAMLKDAERVVRELMGDAIRLDAYDANAGAGGFYAKCGYQRRGGVTYRNTPLIYYELLLTQAEILPRPKARKVVPTS